MSLASSFPRIVSRFGKSYNPAHFKDLESQRFLSILENRLGAENEKSLIDVYDYTKLQKDFSYDNLRVFADESYSRDVAQKLLDHSLEVSKKSVKNVGRFMEDRLKVSNQVYEKFHFAHMSRFIDDFQNQGGPQHKKHYQKIFSNLFYEPKKAEKLYGITQKQVFRALKSGDAQLPLGLGPSDEVLVNLGKFYKKMDDEYLAAFGDVANVGKLSGYVLPVQFNKNAIVKLGRDELREIFIRHVELGRDPEMARIKAQSIADSIFKSIMRDEDDLFFNLASRSRKMKFKSVDDEYEFFNALTGGFDEYGTSVLQRMFISKENLAKKAMLYKDFGVRPEETINMVFRQLQELGVSEKKFAALDKARERTLKTFDMASGFGFSKETTQRYFADGIDKLTSAIFAGVTSLPRQALIDASTHPASFSKMFLNKGSLGGFWFDRFFKPLSFTFKSFGQQAARRPARYRQELNQLLHLFMINMNDNSLTRTMGLGMEQIIQASGTKAETILGRAGKGFDLLTGKLLESVHKYTGNLAHFDSVNAVNVVSSARNFTTLVLKNSSWKDFSADAGKQIAYLRRYFNIGEKEFNALKSIAPMELAPTKLMKTLGFKEPVSALVPDQILKAPLEQLAPFKHSQETARAFRQRLALDYYGFLVDQLHYSQSELTRSTRVVERFMQRGSWPDFFFRVFTKHWNITNDQFQRLRRGLSIAQTGEPYAIGLMDVVTDTGMLRNWAKAFAFYTSAGVFTVWLKDLLDGREPRDLTRKFLIEASAASGVGGVPAAIFSHLASVSPRDLARNPYKGTQVESLISQMIRGGRDPYSAVQAAATLTGLPRIWWADGFTNTLLRQIFLSRSDEMALERWYREKIGGGFLITK